MNTSTVVPFYFQSHEIRTITDEKGSPWFVAKDVCDVLDLSNPTESLRALPEDELTSETLRAGRQSREMNLVSESGLYRLIFRSNKPEAEVFRKWVFREVLPTIRRTGSYQMARESTDRTVEVKHTHLRGTTPPGSLDIRYTLDLSKILLHPSRRSVAMLQRLTGIDLADIMAEESPVDSMNIIFREFFDTTFTRSLNKRVSLAKVYAEYLSWCRNIGCRGYEIAAMRGFGKLVRENGHVVRNSGGRFWVYDISKAEEVEK